MEAVSEMINRAIDAYWTALWKIGDAAEVVFYTFTEYVSRTAVIAVFKFELWASDHVKWRA
jgi:hypothetical protein